MKVFLGIFGAEGISNVQKHMAFAVPPAPGPPLPKAGGVHGKAAGKSQADRGSHLRFLKAKVRGKLRETK